MYETKFTVEGGGEFPVAMLRYDTCFPDSADDAVRIKTSLIGHTNLRKVTLIHRGEERFWIPTIARWNSFVWLVTEIKETS